MIAPPFWLIHGAVAAVWLYEGLWCKLLGGQPHQRQVVEAVPRFGPQVGAGFLVVLGIVEVLIAIWILIRVAPLACAITQTALLAALNACGLAWGRQHIPDPAGMVIKNFAFLVLAWVSAGHAGWT